MATVHQEKAWLAERGAADNISQYSSGPPSYAQNANDNHTHSTSGSTIKIPSRLIYNVSLVSSTSYIGPTKEDPVFAVSHPSKLINCFGLGELVLRDGKEKTSPPLGLVKVQRGSMFRRSLIRVEPGPRTRHREPLDIVMSGDWSRTHELAIPLDNGTTERFEWRNSSGDEVRELSGHYNWGWKLARLDGPPYMGPDAKHAAGYTSDGLEVVAVGAQPRFLHKSPEFCFLNAGARGELGETFEIVALLGFLRLYELHVQQTQINSSAGAASSVAAATG